ncbi:alanine--glyoxylate aminotransferase [Annulohypoxylon bovei var. microspora]|nr:alanine--glyoxylate aminotransferase [Annulohypoxylon bovei var. microspora]
MPHRLLKTTSSSNPAARVSIISRHLLGGPQSAPTNSSFSSNISISSNQSRAFSLSSVKMSSQPEHPTLLIPGPIEFDDAVLQSMSHYSESHVGPGFVATFGEALSMLRKLFQTTSPSSQPFVISGSGTLGWDLVAANLVEAGEDVLVLSSGYFSDGFADCLKIYGANVDLLKAPVGSRPQLPEIEKALKSKKYKAVTVTHVDTSTGVLSELQKLSETIQSVSPETLLIVDGVCSVASEEIDFDAWKLDGVITASQKAIGCPAGLSISMFSGKAMDAFKARKSPPASYFASMKNWTPIMQNYEAKKPSYFATPSPQLIHALHTALSQIFTKPLSERFARHREVSDNIKKAVTDLGLKQVATNPDDQAHGMTAIYLPETVKATDILPKLAKSGVVFAGGIHKEIAAKYIRFGHMGVSVTDSSRIDIEKAINALTSGLADCGYQKA